jgi:RNA polymerase sigma-70 factor (ECF subfamily)
LIRKHCDRLTRRRRLAVTSLEEAAGTGSAMPKPMDPTQIDPTMHHVQDAARREMVHQAVRALPVSEQTVVLLFYMDGLSHQQIGYALGLPVSTVKSRLHEARARLKRRLAQWGEDNLPAEIPSRPNRSHDVVQKKTYLPAPGDKTVLKKKYLKGSG